jgi:hypothetical protein
VEFALVRFDKACPEPAEGVGAWLISHPPLHHILSLSKDEQKGVHQLGWLVRASTGLALSLPEGPAHGHICR